MEKLGLNEIREKYLSFFESKGHLRLPSFPLVPQNDNSILLINAGMTPLKPYFAGTAVPPRLRVTTCQKCIRMPDVERVGKTARHGTYFEMLGNFSFGDYFKKEAIAWSWEFLTEVMKMPASLLWPSVYEEDDEAFDLWKATPGVDPTHIVRLGKADNFWEHGAGPCGPSSEIYFDRGAERGCGSPDCKPGCDCDRFIEIWNNVFTQFSNDGQGNYTLLAKKNIDTGMGLERLACVMQNVESLFEVDTVRRIMEHVGRIAGATYGAAYSSDVSLRIITDHIRSTTFLVCDGVLPSNEGRGYVLRRLLRRAARHGRLLGIKDDFLCAVSETVIAENAAAYPELVEKKAYITRIIRAEEERFRATIDAGLDILEEMIADTKKTGSDVLPGDDAFKLYDTYGFPIDLTVEILAERSMTADRDSFDTLMLAQRERARAARSVSGELAWAGGGEIGGEATKTVFVGYEKLENKTEITLLTVDGEERGSVPAGEHVVLLLSETPFYGESGGQVGDTGVVAGEGGLAIRVDSTTKTHGGQVLHHGTVVSGTATLGQPVEARVDLPRRRAVMRAHTATHLLQKAIRETVGEHAAQAGSLVEPDRLRFDFTHFEALTPEELARIEEQVNESILSGFGVEVRELPIGEAKKLGAMALFGEKYGDVVRVVNVGGGYSVEFCGGTHLDNTAKAGLFKILSESSVAAGVRRVEAVTGEGVLEFLRDRVDTINSAAAAAKASPSELKNRVVQLVSETKESARTIEGLKAKLAGFETRELFDRAVEVGGLRVIAERLSGVGPDLLRAMGDGIRDRAPDAVAVLAAAEDDKISFVAVCGAEAVKKGAHAGNLLKTVAKLCGGGGGGRPDSASAGGKDPTKLDEALATVAGLVADQLSAKK